jgi:hypothetical protein
LKVSRGTGKKQCKIFCNVKVSRFLYGKLMHQKAEGFFEWSRYPECVVPSRPRSMSSEITIEMNVKR